MSTEVTQTATTEEPKATTKTIHDPGLSFSEYEILRKGGKVEVEAKELDDKQAETKSAPEVSTAPEQKSKATESETEASEEQDETGDESETEAKADATDESAKDDTQPKKQSGWQRRIGKLNAKISAAQQEADYWKREALKKAATDSKQDATQAPKATSPATTTEGKPKPDQFEDHESYVEALIDWKADQKLKERELKAEQTRVMSEQEKLAKTYKEKVATFAEKTEDFQETLEAVDHIPLSPAVERLILRSGPELAYALAKDQDRYAAINRMSPVDAAEAVGEIKARLTLSKAADSTKQEPKKTTQAPKPLTPVGGAKTQAGKKSPEEMSYSEYEQYRREQISKRRRA